MDIPRNKLSKVAKIVNGGTPKTKVEEYWNGNINWVTPKVLGKLSTRYIYDTPRKITDLGLSKSSAKLVPKGSVILSTRAPIGYLAIAKTSISTNQGCRCLVPSDQMLSEFIYYFLLGNVDLLNDLGRGTTFKELSKTALSNVPIPVPPLPEQERIVAILDEAFEKIDRAQANIEKNIANAEELFQSKLDEVFSQTGEGWEEKKLGNCGTIQTGSTPLTKNKANYGNYIPFAKPPHFMTSGEINVTAP